MFKTEDHAAIWLGALLLGIGLALFLGTTSADLRQKYSRLNQRSTELPEAPYRTLDWYDLTDQRSSAKASTLPLGKRLAKLTGKPGQWSRNPFEAFYRPNPSVNDRNDPMLRSLLEDERTSRNKAEKLDSMAAARNFVDTILNQQAEPAVATFLQARDTRRAYVKKINRSGYNKLPGLLGLFCTFFLLFALGWKKREITVWQFGQGFLFVFTLAALSYFLAAQEQMRSIGFGYAAWALIIGLLISNIPGTPKFAQPALSTSFYIKLGLVLLGAEILFGKVLAIGLPGIFVAWIVTPIVLVSTFWFGQKILGIKSKTLNMTISADMSVCGVSAAVATAAACKASKEELTLAIGLSMVFTSVMMIVLPLVVNILGLPEVLGGAWIGGTIDATGAVVAAGAFLGDTALNVAATIKMIQNILIGIIALGVAIYFTSQEGKESGIKIGVGEIWKRFPKFILGFIGASILFSGLYAALGEDLGYGLIDHGVIGAYSKNLRGWLFCLAFVSIGLSINFKALKEQFSGGKPLILYLCGQTLNLCLTLLMAYLMFYLVFPEITNSIQ